MSRPQPHDDACQRLQLRDYQDRIIATVSPGAKQGSTAPYGYADFMLVEAGFRQPRRLANAYRKPSDSQTGKAVESLSRYLENLDGCYGAKETRRVMAMDDCSVPNAESLCLDDLASWAADAIRRGEAS